MGVTFASFHSCGTFPVFSDLLNRIVRGVTISFLASLSILGEILSRPGVLFVLVLSIASRISNIDLDISNIDGDSLCH